MKWSRADVERFISYCAFDPSTGCVVWLGGKSRGRGKHAWYGSFWCDGRTRRAHIFAAEAIHGFTRAKGDHVDHKCPLTLCVEHLQITSPLLNFQLIYSRSEYGWDEFPPAGHNERGVPFYLPPAWLPPNAPTILASEVFDRYGHAIVREDEENE